MPATAAPTDRADASISPDLWPASKIEMWPVADLVPYARNARTHPAEQVDQIAASMRRFGFTIPMLVAEDGTIIAGHGRLLAAQLIGMAEVPVMVARGWSDEDRRLYTLADNRLAETSEWDPAMLRLELADLKAALGEDDLASIGFSTEDVVALTKAALVDAGAGLTDPDDVPAPEPVPVSKPGDIWVLGNHRIICGSSTDAATVAAVLAGVKPHLMVTDPPYGVEYDPSWREKAGVAGKGVAKGKVLNDDKADWRDAWALFPGDVAYVWHAGLFAGVVGDSLEATGFKLRSQIIWDKGQLVLGRGDYHWRHEPCWYAVRNGGKSQWVGGRKQTTLWAFIDDILSPHEHVFIRRDRADRLLALSGNETTVWDIPKPRKSETGHGTQKPVECMRRPIENNSQRGDAVYEPFSGSGTTIIAAEMTGRRCHAVELNPAYVDVAVKRWQDYTGREAILEATGDTFNAVAAMREAV